MMQGNCFRVLPMSTSDNIMQVLFVNDRQNRFLTGPNLMVVLLPMIGFATRWITMKKLKPFVPPGMMTLS
jgi:hypothetical protein